MKVYSVSNMRYYVSIQGILWPNTKLCRYTSDIKMVTDGTVFVNIANHVYTIQNISQDMTKHEVLSTAIVIYKVAEMTNDKIM